MPIVHTRRNDGILRQKGEPSSPPALRSRLRAKPSSARTKITLPGAKRCPGRSAGFGNRRRRFGPAGAADPNGVAASGEGRQAANPGRLCEYDPAGEAGACDGVHVVAGGGNAGGADVVDKAATAEAASIKGVHAACMGPCAEGSRWPSPHKIAAAYA